jgi:hypothetical protein
MIPRNLLAIVSLAAGAIGFIVLPTILAVIWPQMFARDCAGERSTINYMWPRSCR